jgi:chitinase
MMKSSALTLIALAAMAFAPSTFCATATPAICAYVFTHGATLTKGQVDPHKITCVNYAFANIEGGRIVEGAPETAGNLAVLTALKHENPNLKVIISVGGWLWSGGFTDMALTHASRAAFIDSAAAFLTRYNLDGLDIDWEFPGDPGAGHAFRPEDKQNYTLLVKELRTRFDAMQKQRHRHLYLTVATGAATDFLLRTEMGKVQKYVDSVNLMAYDYYEPGDEKITGHNAPLNTNPDDPAGISADRSVREYEKAGVPAEKIILGVPFYGHVWGKVPPKNHGLFQPGQPVPNAFADYGNITRTMLGEQGYTHYWDNTSSVPYLYNADKQIFVSYEDPQSIAVKARYVIEHRLAGVMFWEYFGDDASGTLLNTLNATLHPAKSTGTGTP